MNREKIQEEAVGSYNGLGTIVLPTGVGKTKVAIDIAKQFSKVLVIVPRVNLKTQWVKEFKKWGVDVELSTSTRNSFKKITEEFDLLIIDEVHGVCTDKYKEIFTWIKRKNTLGLTATLPEDPDKIKILEENCPIVYKKELENLPEGILSEFKVYNLSTQLGKKDLAKYRVFNQNLVKAQVGLLKYKRDNNLKVDTFELAKANLKDKGELGKLSRLFWSSMTMRRMVVSNSESKIEVAVALISKFPDKKWILFNESIELAEKIEAKLKEKNLKSRLVHSGVKNTEEILKDYAENKFNILNSVKSLIEGTDIPDIDMGLCVSGTSTKLPMIQSLGRIVRKSKNKKAVYINIYNKNTQEEKWVKKKTSTLNPIYTKTISSISI